MRLKSFYGRTLNDAMAEVRSALGADAIIVATRDDEAGGVRVTAAIDETAKDHAPPAPETARSSGKTAPKGHAGEAEADLLDRLSSVMLAHGVPGLLAEKLLGIAGNFDTDDPLLALSAAFDTLFTFEPLHVGEQQRPIALVGLPGVGKTVMTAKLAARARLAGKSVGLISADTVKAGGVEQLQAFARILKTPLMEIEDRKGLQDAAEAQRRNDLIFVDMAGCNSLVNAELHELHELLESIACEPVLVLPAGIDLQDGIESAERFRALGVRKAVFSRIDTTRRLGPLLGIAHEAKLILAEVSHSARIADGLAALNPIALSRLLMPQQDRSSKDALSGRASAGASRKSKAI